MSEKIGMMATRIKMGSRRMRDALLSHVRDSQGARALSRTRHNPHLQQRVVGPSNEMAVVGVGLQMHLLKRCVTTTIADTRVRRRTSRRAASNWLPCSAISHSANNVKKKLSYGGWWGGGGGGGWGGGGGAVWRRFQNCGRHSTHVPLRCVLPHASQLPRTSEKIGANYCRWTHLPLTRDRSDSKS
jgi:hypothetical protein